MAAKLLPASVRDPAVALYAFCREADDVIDEGTAAAWAGCGNGWRWRTRVVRWMNRPIALLPTLSQRFSIPAALPEALLEGFAWDARGRRYQDFSELRAYAVRVAGSVGAMMAVVMGVRDPERLAAAVELGVAMQLSNIARDVGEDARNGRIYLPLEWLAEAGIDPDAFLGRPEHSAALGRVVARLLEAADAHYRRGECGDRALADRLPLRHWRRGAAVRRDRAGGGPARTWTRCPGAPWCLWVAKSWRWRPDLPGWRCHVRPLSGNCVPEGVFLVDAVVSATPRPVLTDWHRCPGGTWRTGCGGPSTLFERLENQERVQTLISRRRQMHDWMGIGLVALGLGLIVSGIMKRRSRMQSAASGRCDPSGVRRDGGDDPAADPVRSGGLRAKDDAVLLRPWWAEIPDTAGFRGFLFVLAAYAGWLVMATKRRR